MKQLNFWLVAVLLVTSQAVRLPSFKGTARITQLVEKDVMNALQKHDNDLSKQIQSLISLSLSQGQYDEIFQVLGEILDDLRNDLRTENQQNAATETSIQEEIDTYNIAWTTAKLAYEGAQTAYQTLNTQINTLSAQILTLEGDMEAVRTEQANTVRQQEADRRAFIQREASHQSTLDALDIIINDLEEIAEGGSGQGTQTELAEISKVVKKMKAIGNTNPLLSLVEFSTMFDPETLQGLIGKLQAIRANVLASMDDDHADQRTSDQTYSALMAGLGSTMDAYVKDKNTKTKTRGQKQGQYQDQLDTYNREMAKYTTNHGLWEGANADMLAEQGRHTAASGQIQSEIDTVEEAISILTNSLGYVQENMNDPAE